MKPVFATDLLDGKVVLVTGAAGGVGSAVARRLPQVGATPVLSDRPGSSLTQGAQQSGARHVAADLNEPAQIEALIDAVLAHYGRLDGLVHCAGVWTEGPSEAVSEADWNRCVDLNLKATFFICSRAIPALRATRGSIVNIASDAGVVGNSGAAVYSASKGGVVLMSRALARELAPEGVRVNALCPADIQTPMLAYQAEAYGDGDPDAYYRRLLAHYPQGRAARFLTADEVALQAIWLLAPASAGITGASVMLDFGLTAGY